MREKNTNLKSKIINFNLKNSVEKELLEWSEKQGKPFATYVKDLIAEDRLKNSKVYNEEELKDMITKVIKEMNISPNISLEEAATTIKNGLGTKGTAAYKNLLNRD